MDQETSLQWPEQLLEGSLMPVSGDDDFSNFLEFGMHVADLQGHGPTEGRRPLPDAIPSATPEEELVEMQTDPTPQQQSQYNHMMADISMDLHSRSQGQDQGQGQGQDQIHPSYSNPDIVSGFYAQEPPQHQHLHQQGQSFHQQSTNQHYAHGQPIIPPTPNSVELHGGAARYSQRVDENNEMYDRYARMNDEQILYTPLISPAMTPLETQFRFPEYTIPGEYFTPLTSPALEAQGSNHNMYPFPSRQISEMGFLQSSMDVSGIPGSSGPSSPGIIRKHRRRPSTSTRLTGRAGKPSPSVRPQTRKKSALNVNSDDILGSLCQDSGTRARPSGGSSLRFGSNESSGQDSVSPEPLSEPLMPPPALPQTRKSPAISPQVSDSQASEAATPATLMRIQRSQHTQDQTGQFRGEAQLVPGESCDDIMEDVVLPEAATGATKNRTAIPRINTAVSADASAPETSASVTPSLEPKSGTLDKASGSVAPSPCTNAMPSPRGPVAKKPDSKTGRSRKRQSMTSSQMSPPLRPKLSPNIQPMVRGDGVSSEASALYLASKSNYQHILDGTLLPGVSYPETLAENLSSKRTNHKLAEQGRRNRINNALKEIEALLPPGLTNVKNTKETACSNSKSSEKEKEKSGNHMISKASTVEMAIVYIKALKKELEETQEKLKVAESKLGGEEAAKTRETSESYVQHQQWTGAVEEEDVKNNSKVNQWL